MSERPRFEVSSKGEAYDVGIRDLRNKLYPLLEEARNTIKEAPELAGHEDGIIVSELRTKYSLEELEKIAEELRTISSKASYIEEDGTQVQVFMQGEVNWLQLVERAQHSHFEHFKNSVEELLREDK